MKPEVRSRTVVTDPEATDHDRGIKQERQRTNGISKAVISARMPSTFIQKWIDEGITLEAAQQRALDHVSERGGDNVNGNTTNIIVGDDTGGKLVRDGMTQALLHRGDPFKFKLDDNARRFRGMSLMDMGRYILGRASVNVEGLDRKQVAGAAMGLQVRAGMHTISRLPQHPRRRIQQETAPGVR